MHQDGHSKINAIVSRDEAQQIHNGIGLPKHGSEKKSRVRRGNLLIEMRYGVFHF